MSQPLRITFEGKDYTYSILTPKITKDVTLIRIELEGQEYELAPDAKRQWVAVDATIYDQPELLKSIGRNIAVRFRL
ncbi:MAG: hypothetical protein V4594_04890 [Bacteroidota bacterium]